MKKVIGLWLVLVALSFTGGGFSSAVVAQSKPVSHAAFDQQLKKFVSSNGTVNYKAWRQERPALQAYLKLLSENAPSSKWTQQEQLAYWINAYNAFTIERILMDYPVKSIKDLGGKVTFVNTVWDQKFFKIGGKAVDLNYIEHSILRKNFEEPRIHFAIVCASVSCPKLRNEAFTAANLEKQLENQTIQFINDPTKNKITATKAELSEIFNWFSGDFRKNGTVLQFVNRYSKIKANPKAKISYKDYNWALNGI
ncbi:hypothetical protein TH63_07670 [Rufibacter radiotolerans]|uniref:DUF547 domain-containing protein n=1 Tax=Rufibacter radiotolerans TaxID=1379910 RepID=A0A0H4VNT8_9BACT|nr:DUF547 domain-containing protein [Rufibacter radiotolerans]AKQ45552.1 hypothetical protein TH63_07670 [Rufibacter radiotolerans]